MKLIDQLRIEIMWFQMNRARVKCRKIFDRSRMQHRGLMEINPEYREAYDRFVLLRHQLAADGHVIYTEPRQMARVGVQRVPQP